MSEHRIQLRRLWDAEIGISRVTVDLPTQWPSGEIPHRLARRFQAPRLRNPAESVFLTFEDVPGLVSATLNGQDLRLSPRDGVWEVDLTDHLARVNQLVLMLRPEDVPTGREWGRIALLIRS